MAIDIIDLLEKVEIDQNDAERSAIAAGSIHFSTQSVEDNSTIPELGKAVMLGKITQLLAGLMQFGILTFEDGNSFAGRPLVSSSSANDETAQRRSNRKHQQTEESADPEVDSTSELLQHRSR
jgi:hypothetical protein